MTIFHHKRISKVIYEFVEQRLDIKLNKRAFIVGSFLPDMPFVLTGVTHKKAQSWALINDMIKKQFTLEFKSKNQLTKMSSMNIGIIIHFISDYFCYYHNEDSNILNHIKYESLLYKEFKTFEKTILEDILECVFKKSLLYNDIKDLIETYHDKYLSFPQSEKKDIVYSIGIPAAVVLSILLGLTANASCAA